MKRLTAIAILLLGFVLLAGMRWTMPRYERITGPIPVSGAPGSWVQTDNLAVNAGTPQLARAIRFKAAGAVQQRDTGGVWLVVPVRSKVVRATARVYGRVWATPDGRRYRASGRAEMGDAVLSSIKALQPGLERKDVLVFELPSALARAGGTLVLSEDRDPQLTAEAQVRYPPIPAGSPVDVLDLDALHARL
ncbi:hypothetical protein [Xanthomonas rydalmerensis]|uniref:DUF4352 domain-containing protein n=1 Tax=Xanthomonas rydalmerensis TaxID=3046274 RepID=A0ABZ0JS33_9XANT|nr:hypothetical protein [Xanthomonas sp. DM-2023]WOS42639.1 hypothetical protein QN243_09440 [Xanthomonas sp. DM-2023]WOS46825.1 hypothetical protein QN242_09440 [Xanthomonas sp. DM-2023]WOS51005.1 hypothetical protein QN240_09440 [Xanthomonas sp. DM-2023]WOS55185.1 hypothetical protein QN244_09440 [Xanthomonas sp. DM-2023]WOS59367.1 hypothetical protein QN245_09440 [Xanthomonas sp. DM-2023]